ncbi:MAG: hypothetical protein JRJ49_03070 [Deltaproteobacteria bacterium]|nr:hypothetical protein [Deltaproteobacteria bacterium]
MKSNKQIFIKLLREVEKNVKNLKDEQFEEFVKGNFRIQITPLKDTINKPNKKKIKKGVSENQLQEVINLLNNTDEREAGLKILNEKGANKFYLAALMKSLDIPSLQRDNIEKLKEKIIEATIGYRLRSKAIQGKSRPNERD